MLKIGMILAGILILLTAGLYYFLHLPMFGKAPSGERLKRIQASPHYHQGKFQALAPIDKVVEGNSLAVMGDFLFARPAGRIPAESLPTEKKNLKNLPRKEDCIVWLGHSSFYMQLNGHTLLVDPVFSPYASPVPFINRAFSGSNVYTAEDLPTIDLLIISHDHWDHLDYPTILSLRSKIKEIVCPLGLGEDFESWGFSPAQIHEEDWYTKIPFGESLSVYLLPVQHFTGRGLEENQTEAAAFAFVTPDHRVFYSGDGGYGRHFCAIGAMFGSFDLAILENGQYNEHWPRIHMMPEETAQAAVDLRAQAVLPAHGGKFALSQHRWQEPYERLLKSSQGKGYRLLTPEIGGLVKIGDKQQVFSAWWENRK